jgi:hypothetical protein
MAGIEPATDGLRNRCSTTELHWLSVLETQIPKLIRYKPNANYFGRVHGNGKLIRGALAIDAWNIERALGASIAPVRQARTFSITRRSSTPVSRWLRP